MAQLTARPVSNRLFVLDPPLNGIDYVLVSTAQTWNGLETAAFSADPDGRPRSYDSLGETFGRVDPAEMVARVTGYEVAP